MSNSIWVFGNLPKMSEYVVSQIIEYDKNAIVIITEYSYSNVKNQLALELGLISIITKQIRIEQLLDLTKKYCSEKSSENKNSIYNSI